MLILAEAASPDAPFYANVVSDTATLSNSPHFEVEQFLDPKFGTRTRTPDQRKASACLFHAFTFKNPVQKKPASSDTKDV